MELRRKRSDVCRAARASWVTLSRHSAFREPHCWMCVPHGQTVPKTPPPPAWRPALTETPGAFTRAPCPRADPFTHLRALSGSFGEFRASKRAAPHAAQPPYVIPGIQAAGCVSFTAPALSCANEPDATDHLPVGQRHHTQCVLLDLYVSLELEGVVDHLFLTRHTPSLWLVPRSRTAASSFI
jgi:hypothetical protein